MSTRGRGWRQRMQVGFAQFCPWCGVMSLQRDDYRNEMIKEQNNPDGVDYVCLTCGRGFRLNNSFRSRLAFRLLREEAGLRPPNDV